MLLLLVIFMLGATVTHATDVNSTNTQLDDNVIKDTSTTNDVSLIKEEKQVQINKDNDNKIKVTQDSNTQTMEKQVKTNSKQENTVTKTSKEAVSTNNKKNTTTTKSIKTSTVDVKTFNDLKNNVNSASGNKTININSNIKLEDSLIFNGNNSLLTINGNGYTIDGDETYQFITVTNTNKLILNNITIMNCYTEDNGAVLINNGTTTIQNSKLYYNYAGVLGGAIYNNATLFLTNNTFISNQAEFFGGAVYTRGTANFVNNNFTYNSAAIDGGAIYSDSNKRITTETTITNNIFNINNAGDRGAAIYNSDGTTKIINSKFIENIGANIIYTSANQKDTTLILENSFCNGTDNTYIDADIPDVEDSIKNQVILNNNTLIGQKIATNLSIEVLNNYVNNTIISVTGLNAFNSPIMSGNVNIYNNNTLIATKSLSNGQTNITLKLPVGLQKITAEYSGNDVYIPSNTTETVQVTKINTETSTQYLKTTPLNTTIKITVTSTDNTKPTGKIQLIDSTGKIYTTQELKTVKQQQHSNYQQEHIN